MKKTLCIGMGVILLLIGCILIIKDIYGENISDTVKDIAVNYVAGKINGSLRDGIYDETLDGQLIITGKNDTGDIVYIEPNSRLINKLVLDFMSGVNEDYSLDDIQVVRVNLGVITGSKILSQLPIMVKVKIQPLSLTKFQYETEFETQGINQTRYCVYCTINSEVRVLAPFIKETAQINRKFLIAEAIIIGKVPESYVDVPREDILDAVD